MSQFIIKNFQADKEVKLETHGLTIIKGISSSGKSSSLKAIQAAVTNRFGSQQVRFGETHADVAIRWDKEGPILRVQRYAEGGSPIMSLNKKTYSKLNRNLPIEVESYNNLGIVSIGSDKFYLNFISQFQPPLLINFSHKKVMEILSASKGVDDYNIVSKRMATLRLLNRGKFQSTDTLISNKKEQLSSLNKQYQYKEPLFSKIKTLYDNYTTLQSECSKLEESSQFLLQKKELENRLRVLTRKKELLDKVEGLLSSQSALSQSENTVSETISIIIQLNLS